MHPRLALLTGTMANAMDDLLHTAILTSVLMLCFAGIGTWRFGSEYEQYADFETTLQTEFELLFGEFQEGWTDSREMALFTVLYLLVLFLLVLNFLLAIIVEAYMQVRRGVHAGEARRAYRCARITHPSRSLAVQRQLLRSFAWRACLTSVNPTHTRIQCSTKRARCLAPHARR